MTCPSCGHPFCECIDLELKALKAQGEDLAKQLDNAIAKAAEFAYRRHPTFFAGTPIPWCNLGESVKEKIRQEVLDFLKG